MAHATANLGQFRVQLEFGADGLVELIGAAMFRIGPGKCTADVRIIRHSMDYALVALEEHAATPADPGAPLSPAGLVDKPLAPVGDDGLGFRIGDGCPEGAAGRVVWTGKAW